MSEKNTIDRTPDPLTVDSLTEHLRRCGLAESQTVLVHTAMSKLGWVVGGAEAVILALLGVVGADGTIMMIANSTGNTDPAEWQHPPVPESWWQTIRDHMPAYNPLTSPTRGLGVVPELFRTWPGVIRSAHPAFSLAALGPQAKYLMAEHPLSDDMGDRSPLGKLYELDGYVLLLGVEHWNNTSLHLAESRANYPGKKMVPGGSAMLVDGRRQWVTYESMDINTDDFGELGAAFDNAHDIAVQQINDAPVRFFKQRLVVDFAVTWMERNRDFRE
ncbi:MAG: AAC(3) family N-acetyltransferase [Anaerolineae bacterium]|nr:AAC(3) family N-acetyltransferase [Anaerolineae bacterium]